MPVCRHVSLSPSLSLPLSLSICGVDLADKGYRARYRVIQVFSWDSKSVPFPVEAHYPNYVSFIRADPESFVREGPTLTTFFSLMGEELSKYHY